MTPPVEPSRSRVLLVDDNAALVDNLSFILEDEGYEVIPSSTGAEALRKAADGFDVALVDLRLPDASGHELAPKLKQVSPGGEIVLLTGYATLETAIEAVRSGAFAYLVKPCSTPDLLLTLEQALRQVRLHAEKRDLARRAQVAEKLAAVGTLTAGLSHEIRNPLNGASLQLAVLERRIGRLPVDKGTQEALVEPLNLVRDEIRRLQNLLDDFLRFARPRELAIAVVNPGPLLEGVANLLAGDAERLGLKLELSVQPGTSPMRADPERVKQVLMNLTLNALQATPAGGLVRLSARDGIDDVLLAVDDSGPGIPQNARHRIFEPFFTTKPSGTGLGLSIVHAIVTQHGGSIGLGDSPLGGARFWVRIPKET